MTKLTDREPKLLTPKAVRDFAKSVVGPYWVGQAKQTLLWCADLIEAAEAIRVRADQSAAAGIAGPSVDSVLQHIREAADPDVAALVAESDDLCSTWPHSHPFRVLNEKLAAALGTLQERVAGQDEIIIEQQRIRLGAQTRADKAETEVQRLRTGLKAIINTAPGAAHRIARQMLGDAAG